MQAMAGSQLRLNRRGRGGDEATEALRLPLEFGDALIEASGLEHLVHERIHVVELAFNDGHRALERIGIE